jgi:hypothetical protein
MTVRPYCRKVYVWRATTLETPVCHGTPLIERAAFVRFIAPLMGILLVLILAVLLLGVAL